MVETRNMSLEDAGWRFCYDEGGKYPLSNYVQTPLVPGETIELYFRAKITQEADGSFYGNSVAVGKAFPYFFFNMMERIKLYNTMFLFGREEDAYPSMKGRAESFSIWDKVQDDAFVSSYIVDNPELIGGKYADVQAAKDDGLVYHYLFDNASMVVQPFDGGTVTGMKTSSFDIVQGKTSNASEMTSGYGDSIFVEGVPFTRSFTMNFRFYLESMDDFVLFHSNNIGEIVFDAGTETFSINLIPTIGYPKSAQIQVGEQMKLHHWYDFTITYGQGVLRSYMDGVFLEENVMNVEIGGVEKYKRNTSNFESITIDTQRTSPSFAGNGHDEIGYVVPDKTFNIVGADIFSDMLSPEYVLSGVVYSPLEEDLVESATKTMVFDTYMVSSYINNKRETSIIVDKLNSSVRIFMGGILGSGGYTTQRSGTTRKLVPLGYTKITLVVKDVLEDDTPVFPMIFTLPGEPLSVEKIDISDYEYMYQTGSFLTDEATPRWWTHQSTVSADLTIPMNMMSDYGGGSDQYHGYAGEPGTDPHYYAKIIRAYVAGNPLR